MVLDITNRCRMKCPHCFNECVEDGEDMSLETLDAIIRFILENNLQFRLVIISGGEPTEHPSLFQMLDKLTKDLSFNASGEKILCMIASNGMFLNESETYNEKSIREYIDRLLNYEIMIQITADPRFYKTGLNKNNLSYLQNKGGRKVSIEKNLIILSEQGRALINPMPENLPRRNSPFCFNVRSMVQRSKFDFQKVVDILENQMNKYCAVGFDMHGNIRISESLTCPALCTIKDDMNMINRLLVDFNCDGCVHMNRLPTEFKHVIGLL